MKTITKDELNSVRSRAIKYQNDTQQLARISKAKKTRAVQNLHGKISTLFKEAHDLGLMDLEFRKAHGNWPNEIELYQKGRDFVMFTKGSKRSALFKERLENRKAGRPNQTVERAGKSQRLHNANYIQVFDNALQTLITNCNLVEDGKNPLPKKSTHKAAKLDLAA